LSEKNRLKILEAFTTRHDAEYFAKLVDNKTIADADNKRKPVKSGLRIAGETPYYGANNIQDYLDMQISTK